VKLSIVIVNYNVRYFLEQALLSVQRAIGDLETEVWVVDNHSVDDSVAMVRQHFPWVKLIVNEHNPGFSVANNQAIRRSRGEYVLLLNPDTVLREDTLQRCAAYLDAHPDVGGLGVRMIDGAGNFLPESKRGLPTPWVAFTKATGLSRLFPRSRLFNRYHLGYLSPDEIHEVDVLAGAFMWLRRSVLDEIGLLDEQFFMYGEDIDLSYRIQQAGYRNVYFPATSIIHYKGESTKKGSLNYVRVFYQAMILFARKHFSGGQAGLYVGLLRVAVYLRAGLTLVHQFFRRVAWPLVDAVLLYAGLAFWKHFWAVYHFNDAEYYAEAIYFWNFPLYVGIWLLAFFFSGAYDRPFRPGRLVRGWLTGTLVLLAIYGLLSEGMRSGRALVLLGAVWALALPLLVRYGYNLLRHGKLRLSGQLSPRLAIVGSAVERDRVLRLLQRAEVRNNYIGRVRPAASAGLADDSIGTAAELPAIAEIYRLEELIFCAKDVSSQEIMSWMTQLGPGIQYKILPETGISIIGSHSKDSPGQLYTVDISYRIDQPVQRRNKRVFDLLLSLVLLGCWLLLLGWWWLPRPLGRWSAIGSVLLGRRTWVGYFPGSTHLRDLPRLRPGVLPPYTGRGGDLEEATKRHLNVLYAKDYAVEDDWRVVWQVLQGGTRSESDRA
jgi:GT2 family glycosyltransferase